MQDINPLDPAGMSWRLVATVSCILCWKIINTLLEMALDLRGFDSAYRMENLRSSHFFRPHHRWRKRKLWWGRDCFLVLLNWFPRGKFTSRRKTGRESTTSAERADWWDKGQGPTVTAFQVLWTWWPAVLPHKTPPGSAQRTLGSQGDRGSMACQSSPGEVRMLVGSARMWGSLPSP